MEEHQIKELAEHLRKPHGEVGVEVGNHMNVGNGPMNLHTLAVLNPQPNDHILEIGMGNGAFVRNILGIDSSIHYTGCDYSETMVRESIKNNSELVDTGRAVFHHTDAENLPIEDQSVTKLFTVNTFYFWQRREHILQEFKRVLAPEGKLILAVRPKHNLEKFAVTRYGFSMLSKSEISDILHHNGFGEFEYTEIKEPDQHNWKDHITRETLIISCSVV